MKITPRMQSTLNIIAINTLCPTGTRRNQRLRKLKYGQGCPSDFLYWNTIAALIRRGLVKMSADTTAVHDETIWGNTDVELTEQGIEMHQAW